MRHTPLTPLSRLLPAVVVACLTWLPTACTQDESPVRLDGTVPAADSVPLQLASVRLQSQPEADTRTTTAFRKDGAQIGIYRLPMDGSNTAVQENVPYTYTDGKGWQPTDPARPIYLLNVPTRIIAYYPYSADPSSIILHSQGPVGDSGPGVAYCHSEQTVDNTMMPMTIQLKHLTAMVRVGFTKDPTYDTTQPLKVGAVFIGNLMMAASGRLDVLTGTIGNMQPGLAIWQNQDAPLEVTLPNGQEPTSWAELSVLPTPAGNELKDNIRFRIMVLGTDFEEESSSIIPTNLSISASWSATKLPNLEAGKLYTFIFNIQPGKVEVKDVKVMNWNLRYTLAMEAEEISNDYVEMAGEKWARSNLAWSADRGYYLADNSEEKQSLFNKDNGVYGYWATGTIIPESKTSAPCGQVEPKGTWTIPTDEQLAKLTGSADKVVTGEADNGGVWYGAKTIDVAQANPHRYPYLPHSMYMGNTLPNGQTVIYYLYGEQAMRFEYGNDTTKGIGSSIRCIKKSVTN